MHTWTSLYVRKYRCAISGGMRTSYQLPPTARKLVSTALAVTSTTRKQINCRNRRRVRPIASRRQQIDGTKRPQNAGTPLNGCNSKLTTRWLSHLPATVAAVANGSRRSWLEKEKRRRVGRAREKGGSKAN